MKESDFIKINSVNLSTLLLVKQMDSLKKEMEINT